MGGERRRWPKLVRTHLPILLSGKRKWNRALPKKGKSPGGGKKFGLQKKKKKKRVREVRGGEKSQKGLGGSEK